MTSKETYKQNGFTLLELLIVVLIVGILTAIVVPQYLKTVERSRMAEAVTNLRTLYNAEQHYFLATGNHPSKLSDLDVSIQGEDNGTDGITAKYFHYATYTGGLKGFAAYRLPLPKDDNYAIFIRYESNSESAPSGPLLRCNVYGRATDVQKKLCQEIDANHSL